MDLTTETARRAALHHLDRATVEVRALKPYEGPTLNLPSLLVDASTGRLHGENREALEEVAHRAGVSFDPHRPYIPFAACRDLGKGTASAGGFLIGTETQDSLDILRPQEIPGLLMETGLQGDQVVPKTTAKTVPVWLQTETSQVTPSTPTLAEIAMTPKTTGAFVQFSRRLALQANAEGFVRRELSRTVRTAVLQAVLNGSGAAGQPTGLLNTAGIQTQTGTSIALAGVTAMKRKVADANAPDSAISYVGTPAVRELLENRERSANGNGFVWDDDKVASRPARVTTDLPAATLVCGAWEAIYVGIWGEGFLLEVNPYDPTAFRSGMIQARVLLSCDVAVLHAPAFCVATSVT